MKIITFTKNSGAYCPGDRAGFDDAQADAYVARGDALHAGQTPVDLPVSLDGTGTELPPADNTVKTGRKPRQTTEPA